MMKRSLVVGITTALALWAVPASAEMGGNFYVGVQGGYGATEARASTAGGVVGANLDSISGSGANGGVFAGWGQRFNRFYVGLEVDAAYSDADFTAAVSDGVDTANLSIKQRETFAASIMPGFVLNESSILYVRAGAARTGWRGSYSDTTGVSGSSSQRKTGLRLGGGIQTGLANNVLLRADYTHTRYGSISQTDGGVSTSIRPRENLFRIGAGLQF